MKGMKKCVLYFFRMCCKGKWLELRLRDLQNCIKYGVVIKGKVIVGCGDNIGLYLVFIEECQSVVVVLFGFDDVEERIKQCWVYVCEEGIFERILGGQKLGFLGFEIVVCGNEV